MAIGTISGGDLKSAQDYMFNNVTVPANTTTTGTAQLVGKTQAELEIVVIVGDTSIVITDTKVFSVSLTASETVDGSFTALTTLYTKTASGATTLASGTVLARYVVKPSDPLFAKAVATTNDASVVGSLDVYIRRVCR